MSESGQFLEETKALFNVGSKTENEHMDIGKARRCYDKEDDLKLVF